jgi:hypothetical protein
MAICQVPAFAQTDCSFSLNYTVLKDVDKKTADDAQAKLAAQGASAATNCDDSECSVILPITLNSTMPETVAASIKQDLEELDIEADVTCGGGTAGGATAGTACTITPEQQAKFNTSTDQLALSVRTYNGLRAANITTLGALASKTPAELLALRNFSKKSVAEVETLLASHGLRSGMKTSCP